MSGKARTSIPTSELVEEDEEQTLPEIEQTSRSISTARQPLAGGPRGASCAMPSSRRRRPASTA